MSSYWKCTVGGGLAIVAVASPAFAKSGKRLGLSSVQQVVVVMMENRSFDHALGWHPAADGTQDGLSFIDDAGIVHPTANLGAEGDYQGCGRADPDHSWKGGRIDLDSGAMDGFLKNVNCPAPCPRDTTNDDFAVGYYDKDAR